VISIEAKGRIAPQESPRSIQDAVRRIQRDTRPDLDRQKLTEALNRHFRGEKGPAQKAAADTTMHSIARSVGDIFINTKAEEPFEEVKRI
jgi:hypothetical protein